jgi:hypothetical protein
VEAAAELPEAARLAAAEPQDEQALDVAPLVEAAAELPEAARLAAAELPDVRRPVPQDVHPKAESAAESVSCPVPRAVEFAVQARPVDRRLARPWVASNRAGLFRHDPRAAAEAPKPPAGSP